MAEKVDALEAFDIYARFLRSKIITHEDAIEKLRQAGWEENELLYELKHNIRLNSAGKLYHIKKI